MLVSKKNLFLKDLSLISPLIRWIKIKYLPVPSVVNNRFHRKYRPKTLKNNTFAALNSPYGKKSKRNG